MSPVGRLRDLGTWPLSTLHHLPEAAQPPLRMQNLRGSST